MLLQKPQNASISVSFVCHWHEFGIRDWRPPRRSTTLSHGYFMSRFFRFIFVIRRLYRITNYNALQMIRFVSIWILFVAYCCARVFFLSIQLRIFAVNIIASLINSHQITVKSLHFTLQTYHICDCVRCYLAVLCHEICIPKHTISFNFGAIEKLKPNRILQNKKIKKKKMKKKTKSHRFFVCFWVNSFACQIWTFKSYELHRAMLWHYFVCVAVHCTVQLPCI